MTIATGAHWTREILSKGAYPVNGIEGDTVFASDDILAGAELEDPVVTYDFDHYYMGSCLAELLRQRGNDVAIVTTANPVSAWTFMSNELAEIRRRMIDLDIATVFEQYLTGFSNGAMELTSIYRDSDVSSVGCGSLIVVGARTGNDSLFLELNSGPDRIANAGMSSLRSIGDCRAPGAIAYAVYSGHECPRTIDAGNSVQPIEWERPRLSSKA
jgi:dimethylamine/trimethylamine dehydrogenase